MYCTVQCFVRTVGLVFMYIRWVFMYGNVMCGNRENKMRYKKSNVWVKLKKERQRKA